MQEEVENKTLMLMINGTKFSGRLLKTAISRYLAHCKDKKLQKSRDVTPHGKQSVKQLIGQNQGTETMDFTDPSIREFDRIARKYGVELSAAFQEYSEKQIRKASRPSVLQRLNSFKELLKNTVVSRDRRREKVR